MATSMSKTGTNDDNVIFETGNQEVARLNRQHQVIAAAMPSLILAPLELSKPGLRILDQATGGGAWLYDVRSKAPAEHTYVGTDIVDAYFPASPPANMSFAHQSMTADWPADWAGTFDLVHSRYALPGSGTNPMRDTVAKLLGLVKPGGYIQLVENIYDGWQAGPAAKAFCDAAALLMGTVTNGQALTLNQDCGAWLREAGLEGIEERVVDIPMGITAPDAAMKDISRESMVATAGAVTTTLKKMPQTTIPREKLDSLPEDFDKELREQGGAFKVFAVWGRKPV